MSLIMAVAFIGMSLRAKRGLKYLSETGSLMRNETSDAPGAANDAYGSNGHGGGDIGGVEDDRNDGMAYHARARDSVSHGARPAAESVDISYQVNTPVCQFHHRLPR
jgi:UPF0716 family protein affecting phage T7 exclusion